MDNSISFIAKGSDGLYNVYFDLRYIGSHPKRWSLYAVYKTPMNPVMYGQEHGYAGVIAVTPRLGLSIL